MKASEQFWRNISPLIVSLTFAAILLLCGCATNPPVDRSDRPWLNKPAEIQPEASSSVMQSNPPPKTFLVLCDVEGSPIAGLQWGLERSVDLKVWMLVATVPAPVVSGIVAFMGTNDAPFACYRVRTVYPP